MISERFDWLVNNQCERIKSSLLIKGEEYRAGDKDAFHNFKVAGARRNITPERALDGMLLKHEVSIADIINNLDKGILPDKELLSEKIKDIINYYILLENLILERLDGNS